MTEEGIADLAGFSRRNYPNWRAGQGSYGKTVRGLFEIHALVSGLVRVLGTAEALSWLTLPGSDGSPRRESLSTEEGRAQLLREASAFLFAQVEHESQVADFEEDREGVELAELSSGKIGIAGSPPNRRRKPR